MGRSASTGAVYICEDVSSIEFKDGLFYLTDHCGEFGTIRRAMRPHTFIKCVRCASKLVREFEATHGGNVSAIDGPPDGHAA